jgi:hypothetical protein
LAAGSWLFDLGYGFVLTVTVASDENGVPVMDHAVQDGRCHRGVVGEGRWPVFVGTVGGDDGGGALVSAG